MLQVFQQFNPVGSAIVKKLTLPSVVGASLIALMHVTSANAQATRTWVSGVGDDVNPCSRTAPCKTFAGAISKTAINGEINCLDPGGFGAVTITKSMTIDCHEVMAGIVTGGGNGIVISIAAGNANDPLRTARLRNININGAGVSGTVGTRLGLVGVRIDAAAAVFLDDMLVYNMSQKGLLDQRIAAGKLFIRNSAFRTNGQAGIQILPSSGSATIDAVIDDSHSTGNVGSGIVVSNGPRVAITRSVFSGNAGAGVDAEASVGGSSVTVDESTVSSNGNGFFQAGGGSIRVSNTDVAFNNTLNTGTVNSFSNNRLTGNGAGAFTPIGGATPPTGQQ
jgi:Right handed beta helix region